MSINLGNEAIEAARTLRPNPQWKAVLEGLHKQVVARMNAALEAAPEHRHDATGYARGLRDLWLAFETATTGEPIQKVTKPGPEKARG